MLDNDLLTVRPGCSVAGCCADSCTDGRSYGPSDDRSRDAAGRSASCSAAGLRKGERRNRRTNARNAAVANFSSLSPDLDTSPRDARSGNSPGSLRFSAAVGGQHPPE